MEENSFSQNYMLTTESLHYNINAIELSLELPLPAYIILKYNICQHTLFYNNDNLFKLTASYPIYS